MGNFTGHAMPGAFVSFLGLWWGIKFSFSHLTQKNKNKESTRLTRVVQKRLEIAEALIVIVFATIGIVTMHIAGAKLPLYDYTRSQWSDLKNWQHCTMFMFFGLAGSVSLIVHTTAPSLLSLDRILLGLAFFNKGLLISYHIHGQTMVDITVHQLLVLSIYADALILFLEFFCRGNIALELTRSFVSVLQGSWYWQIGFVLYPPSGPQWDLEDHSNVMFVVMCFSWHLMCAVLFTGLVYGTVSCVVHARLKRTSQMHMGLLEKKTESEDDIF